MRRIFLFLLVVALLALAACDGARPNNGAGSAAGSPLQVTLQPAPEGAGGDHLTVRVVDAGGQPVTGATVGLEGNMNHAGMVPVFAEPVADDADGIMDGAYRVPFSFTMQGDWIITVSAKLPDGTSITKDIDVTVTQDGVTVKE